MSSAVLSSRLVSLLAGVGLLVAAGAASAQSLLPSAIPEKQINRDLVRRALLDTCVYGEAAKEGAKKEKVADACQCASFKAMKGVKDEDVAKIAAASSIPDDMYKATTEAFGSCMR